RPVPLGPLSGAARAEAPGAARAGGVRRRRGPCRGGPTPRPGKTGCCYRPYGGCCVIVRVGVAVGLSFAWSCPGVPGAGWRSSGLAGEGCQGGGGEVAAGDGLAEVADGGGEGPFA